MEIQSAKSDEMDVKHPDRFTNDVNRGFIADHVACLQSVAPVGSSKLEKTADQLPASWDSSCMTTCGSTHQGSTELAEIRDHDYANGRDPEVGLWIEDGGREPLVREGYGKDPLEPDR